MQYQSNPQYFKALFPNLRISSDVYFTRTFNVAVFDDKMVEILKVHRITVSRGRLTPVLDASQEWTHFLFQTSRPKRLTCRSRIFPTEIKVYFFVLQESTYMYQRSNVKYVIGEEPKEDAVAAMSLMHVRTL